MDLWVSASRFVFSVHSIDCYFIFIWLLPIASIPAPFSISFLSLLFACGKVQHQPPYSAWLTESIVQFRVLTFHKNECVLLRDVIGILYAWARGSCIWLYSSVQMDGKQWIPMRVLGILFFYWPIAFEYLMRLRSAREMLPTRSEFGCSEQKCCQLKISHLLIAVRNERTWNNTNPSVGLIITNEAFQCSIS